MEDFEDDGNFNRVMVVLLNKTNITLPEETNSKFTFQK